MEKNENILELPHSVALLVDAKIWISDDVPFDLNLVERILHQVPRVHERN